MSRQGTVGAVASARRRSSAPPTFVAAGAKADTAAGTSVVPGLPAGLAQNDYMVMAVSAFKVGGLTVQTPAGWTQLAFRDTTGGWNLDSYLFGKVAGASESAPTVSTTGGISGFLEAQIWAYRGVSASTPVDATAVVGTNVAGPTLTQPSITTVTANAMVTWAGLSQAAGTWGVPSGETRRQGTSSGNIMVLGIADKVQASPGSAAGQSWTQQAGGMLSIVVALRPA